MVCFREKPDCLRSLCVLKTEDVRKSQVKSWMPVCRVCWQSLIYHIPVMFLASKTFPRWTTSGLVRHRHLYVRHEHIVSDPQQDHKCWPSQRLHPTEKTEHASSNISSGGFVSMFHSDEWELKWTIDGQGHNRWRGWIKPAFPCAIDYNTLNKM